MYKRQGFGPVGQIVGRCVCKLVPGTCNDDDDDDVLTLLLAHFPEIYCSPRSQNSLEQTSRWKKTKKNSTCTAVPGRKGSCTIRATCSIPSCITCHEMNTRNIAVVHIHNIRTPEKRTEKNVIVVGIGIEFDTILLYRYTKAQIDTISIFYAREGSIYQVPGLRFRYFILRYMETLIDTLLIVYMGR